MSSLVNKSSFLFF
jgi:hypothetical protein